MATTARATAGSWVAALLALSACRGPGTMKVMCPEGYEQCGVECVDLQRDSKHCGACDRACSSTQECIEGKCEPLCPTGQHGCNGQCMPDTAVETCGKRCTPCPAVAHGVATCDGMKCGATCDIGYRFCGGVCALCPSGQSTKCMGTQCVGSGCPVGEHLCNGQCVPEGPGSCGDACLNCPAAPTGGFQVCLNGGCEYLCRAGYRSCGSACCPADFIEAGGEHTCAVTPAGAITCWGRNHIDATHGGAIGDGTLIDRAQPMATAGPSSGLVAVQAGAAHTCSVNQFGAVACWGVGENGRLGDGTTSDKLIPTALSDLPGGTTAHVSAGGAGGCALTRVGEVQCWGKNDAGQVGDGTTLERTAPSVVGDLGTRAVDVVVGGAHACAVMRGGTVRCWGDNSKGQLGDGTRQNRLRPTAVVGLADATRISAGEQHTCVVRAQGGIQCWGDNAAGQVGAPAAEAFRELPFNVPGIAQATEVSAGGAHTCALVMGGALWCWGANESGQLGDGTTMGRPMAAAVSGISDGTSVSAGKAHTCARTQSGTRCWGNNEFGQLGDGTTMNRPTPVSTR